MLEPTAPKVFLSHAGEDKDRFVLRFAAALRARGLDVWLDRWELLPGDSLVERIFTEGIDQADAFVVVISRSSVSKKWVREELNAAIVKRIEDDTRLIPVVLDGLGRQELPAAIRHLLWEAVPDLDDLDVAVERVARAVFGQQDKPAIGAKPGYAAARLNNAPGLTRIDSLILKAAGDEAVRDFGDMFRTAEFFESLKELGIEERPFLESMDVLEHDGYVELHKTLGSGLGSIHSFKLTTYGFHVYAEAYIDDYDDCTRDICLAISDSEGGQGTDDDVAQRSQRPRMFVIHVLRMLASQGLVRLSEPYGPNAFFHGVSPKLRRILDE